jgi:hypothetical protein
LGARARGAARRVLKILDFFQNRLGKEEQGVEEKNKKLIA